MCAPWTTSSRLTNPKPRSRSNEFSREITDLFHYGNQDTIHQAVQGLRTRYNGEFDATVLLDQLDQLKTPEAHWAFTSPAAMIGAAICIFALGLCPWKCCHRSQETSQPQPSAPPMPPAILAPQPASAPRMAPTPVPKNNNNNRATRGNNAIPINITITWKHQDMFKKEPQRRGEISEMIYL
jgi:hypothetical protein